MYSDRLALEVGGGDYFPPRVENGSWGYACRLHFFFDSCFNVYARKGRVNQYIPNLCYI